LPTEPNWAKPIKSAIREAKAAVGVAEAIVARDEQREEAHEDAGLRVINGLPDSAFSHATQETGGGGSFDTGVAVENEVEGGGRLSPPRKSFEPLSRTNSGDSMVMKQEVGGEGRESMDTIRQTPPIQAQAQPQPQLQLESRGTTKFSPRGYTRPGVPLSWDSNETPTSSLLLDASSTIPEDSPLPSLSDPFSLPSKFIPSLTTIEKAVSTKIYLETKYHALLKTPPTRETRKYLLEKELSRLNLRESEKEDVREAWRVSETEYLREMRRKVGVESFKKLKTIGRGAFGVVSLVRETGSGECVIGFFSQHFLRKLTGIDFFTQIVRHEAAEEV